MKLNSWETVGQMPEPIWGRVANLRVDGKIFVDAPGKYVSDRIQAISIIMHKNVVIAHRTFVRMFAHSICYWPSFFTCSTSRHCLNRWPNFRQRVQYTLIFVLLFGHCPVVLGFFLFNNCPSGPVILPSRGLVLL